MDKKTNVIDSSNWEDWKMLSLEYDDDNGLSRIKNWVTSQLRDAVTWINTEDGQILGISKKSHWDRKT